MARFRIALLNAAHPEAGPQRGSRAAALASRNFRRELDVDLAEFAVVDGDLPGTVGFDAVVLTGSRASAYWDERWIDGLGDWVRGALGRGLPILGVCFGHQLLARVLGGTVAPAGDYELGYVTIDRAGESPLLDGLDDPFVAFASHSDTVVALPETATVIAENEAGVQGFQIGNAFGIQFHPEYDPETARIVAERKDLPDERIRRVLDGITDENYAAACRTKRLFDNFESYVEARAAVDQSA